MHKRLFDSLFQRNPWLFSIDDGGQGSGGAGGAGGEGTGEGGEGAGSEGAGGGSGAGGEAKSFTQEDVDRIVAERLKRAKSTPPPDYDDLKTKAAKLDELELKNKSDLEKAQEASAAAEQRAAEASERANRTLRRASIIAEAAKANAADVDAVFVMLENTKQYSDLVTIDDDGEVTGAADAVTALLKAKPYLVGKSTANAGSADGGTRTEGGGEKPKTLEDAVQAAMSK